MTQAEKIIILKQMLDDSGDSDEVLSAYLNMAEQKILNRMHQFHEDYEGISVPDKYVMVQLNIAVYLLNKRGAEGEIQHIENGIHRNYGSADIPDALLKDVVPFCKAIR